MTTRSIPWLPALLSVLAAACYNPAILPGAQQCAPGDQCPAGQYCAPDKHCYPDGVVPTCAPACSGQTKLCDKATLRCVQCLADNDCPAGFLCAAKVCKPGCRAGHPGCGADAGACDVDLGVCRGCLHDEECPMAAARCEPMSGACVPCLAASDNCPDGQYCDETNNSRACKPGCKDVAGCSGVGDGGPVTPSCCAHQCADLDSDDRHCGSCDKACDVGQHCCAAGCVDYQTDLNNCGSCGAACKPKNVTGPSCKGGACDYGACSVDFDDCDKSRANGCEASLADDIKNCGACGNACPTPPNAMAVCTKGVCTIAGCNANFADCNMNFADGCEVSLKMDIRNCGVCGRICPSGANSTATCNGVCGLQCTAGFGDCDGAPGNGCEINLLLNVANCGGCGKACAVPNATPACAAGACAVGVCANGFADCNKMVVDGCEVTLGSDLNNCGICGGACSANNVVARRCTAGACDANCNNGFADCDNNKQTNGCEVAAATDPNNCGVGGGVGRGLAAGCGVACSNNNMATRTCAAGVCSGACLAGFADCDGNKQTNGCEIATATDAKNCGACGVVCPTGANVTTVACVGGGCRITGCAAGFADCDAMAANGCEINLNTDAKNCGACAKVCAAQTPNCLAGVCSGSFLHHDGLGHTWTDAVPTSTFTLMQAGRACQEFVNQGLGGADTCTLNGCGCGGNNLCVYNTTASPRHTWFYNMDTMSGQVTLNCCGCAFTNWD